MPQKVFENITENNIEPVVDYLLNSINGVNVITFSGDLGAGKTTLIKEYVRALGSQDVASSPTFGLINEYRLTNGVNVYHADWYRMNSEEELYDAGMEEYLDNKNALFLIEWPAIGASLLKGLKTIDVEIEHLETGRNYKLNLDL